MKSFWRIVNEYLGRGESVFVARVVEHTAHSPGTTGAGLVVASTGFTKGTIGGGVMEQAVIERAGIALGDSGFGPHLQTLLHGDDGATEPSGLICAGRQTNLYLVCRPEADADVVRQAARAQAEGTSGEVIITETGIRYRDVSARPSMVQSSLKRRPEGWRYTEQVLNLRRVAIFGGGHCGLALSRVMHHLGYDVSVCDTRIGLHTMDENSFADRQKIVKDFADVGRSIPYPELTDVVVMTTNLGSDVRSLRGVAELPFRTVGVMGSAAKIAAIKKALKSEGVSEAAVSRLTAPVGLPIGSDTPDEIAVSVAAQLVMSRRQEEAGAIRL